MIATAVLRSRVRVDPYRGTSGTGAPVFDIGTNLVPCRRVGKRHQIRTSTGVDLICDETFQFRPNVDIPPQSVITDGTESFTVIDTAVARELSRPHHLDVFVEGPRPAATS